MIRFRTASSETAASRAADFLCLAAAPVFAVLALLTASGGMLCTMPGMSALSGMSVMYLLMSVFHAAPWLKRKARPTSTHTLFTQPNKGD